MITMFREATDVADQHLLAMIAEEQAEHIEEDGVDWCAWWAEYAEMREA